MSAPGFASVNGQQLSRLLVTVPSRGAWYADVDFIDAADLSGKVTITAGALTLVGTVTPDQSGVFGEQRKARIVAGAGGWSSAVQPVGYHNDAGVKARTVAEDAARAVGETIGSFVPTRDRLGVDYARELGPAARTLEDAAGGATWWVDYAGVTNVGPRPEVKADTTKYDLLAYDPRSRVATLGLDDPSAVVIGSVLTERLDAPQAVRSLELLITPEEMRMTAWLGGGAQDELLPGLLRAIIARAMDGKLYGRYRYRVVEMASGRVNLQAISKAAGLPDLLNLSMWPGVAGAHAELAAGSEVRVEFLEGDRAQPEITGFAGKDGPGHVPESLTFCGSKQAAARQGDLVQSGGVGTVVTLVPAAGTLLPGPLAPCLGIGIPYLISFSAIPPTPLTAAPLYGAISTGSPKVRT